MADEDIESIYDFYGGEEYASDDDSIESASIIIEREGTKAYVDYTITLKNSSVINGCFEGIVKLNTQ
ncbi:MAG: hypothetical protein R2753_12895 [Chitinophagales bacterium]